MKKSGIIVLSICSLVAATGAIVLTVLTVNSDPDRKRIAELSKTFKPHYAERIVKFENENKTLKTGDTDVVFLGDSLTERCDLNKYYPSYKVLNRGIGGDTTIGVETRLGVSVYIPAPKLTVMLIGANNLNNMFDNYENILKKFKDDMPQMKVILCSLTPETFDYSSNIPTIISNNEKILEYANKYSYTYVDLFNPLLDSSTNELKEEYTIDGSHFTDKGYKVISSVLNPEIEKIIK